MYKQGTVILTPFPFSDLSEDKVRPAVIVSKGLVEGEVVVAFVTSKTKTNNTYTTAISPSISNGLRLPSVLVSSKIATISKKIVLGELGTLNDKDKREVLKSIKAVLGL
jgi:mRNA interferase MazF